MVTVIQNATYASHPGIPSQRVRSRRRLHPCQHKQRHIQDGASQRVRSRRRLHHRPSGRPSPGNSLESRPAGSALPVLPSPRRRNAARTDQSRPRPAEPSHVANDGHSTRLNASNFAISTRNRVRTGQNYTTVTSPRRPNAPRTTAFYTTTKENAAMSATAEKPNTTHYFDYHRFVQPLPRPRRRRSSAAIRNPDAGTARAGNRQQARTYGHRIQPPASTVATLPRQNQRHRLHH